MDSSDSDRDPVEQLAEEFVERYRRGERPSLQEYTDRYPEGAERIRALFPALVVMDAASGGVHGVSATCTHQGCRVNPPAHGVVSCPCHGSRFDAATGKVLNGPATAPLPEVPVSVQGTDVVRS